MMYTTLNLVGDFQKNCPKSGSGILSETDYWEKCTTSFPAMHWNIKTFLHNASPNDLLCLLCLADIVCLFSGTWTNSSVTTKMKRRQGGYRPLCLSQTGEFATPMMQQSICPTTTSNCYAIMQYSDPPVMSQDNIVQDIPLCICTQKCPCICDIPYYVGDIVPLSVP